MADNYDQKAQPENSRSQRRDTSWGPLVPIIVIVTIALAILDRPRSDAADRHIHLGKSAFSDTAFLGAIERRVDSSTFQQGEAAAFMGGIDLDFRDAIIEGDEARLDITAVMGGVKIRIPRTWNVVNRVEAALGGVKDNTHSTNGNKRLVVEGTVLMGGLDITN